MGRRSMARRKVNIAEVAAALRPCTTKTCRGSGASWVVGSTTTYRIVSGTGTGCRLSSLVLRRRPFPSCVHHSVSGLELKAGCDRARPRRGWVLPVGGPWRGDKLVVPGAEVLGSVSATSSRPRTLLIQKVPSRARQPEPEEPRLSCWEGAFCCRYTVHPSANCRSGSDRASP